MSISSTRASNGVSGFCAALRERIEVDHDQVDRRDAVPGDGLEVVGPMAARQDAAVDAGCRVLTRPSIISGKPVTSETLMTGSPAVGEGPGGAAGRDQLDAEGGQAAGEVDQAGFVGNTQNCAHNVSVYLTFTR